MDRRIAYIIIALIASILFFIAIGYYDWTCGGSNPGPSCIKTEAKEVIGALLLTAGLLILIAGIFLIIFVVTKFPPSETASVVIAILAAIIAISGVFYHLYQVGIWSPFIATIAMSLSAELAAILLIDLITSKT
ncbi:expressed protein [Echinococcus multilocularis]|uniref:Expressed protein n=1 Tax=Echinococcus multilocularis TaxID=6211 RepID=A0A087VXP3_ECHMU|nr:expressed protein [Echinococcus multilocularis]